MLEFGNQRIIAEGLIVGLTGLQFRQHLIELTVQVALQQLGALYLTAGRLWDTRNWYDCMNFESGVFANDVPHRVNQRPKLINAFSKQHENNEFFSLATFWCGTCNNHFVEIEVRKLRNNFLDIMRVIILAVDNNDVFLAACDYEVTVDKYAAVTCAKPAVVREQFRRGFRVTVNPFGHTIATQQYVADMPIGERLVIIAGNTNADVSDCLTYLYKTDRVPVCGVRRVVSLADLQTMTIHHDAL